MIRHISSVEAPLNGKLGTQDSTGTFFLHVVDKYNRTFYLPLAHAVWHVHHYDDGHWISIQARGIGDRFSSDSANEGSGARCSLTATRGFGPPNGLADREGRLAAVSQTASASPSPAAPTSQGVPASAVGASASVVGAVPESASRSANSLTLASMPVPQISTDLYRIGLDGTSQKQLTHLGLRNINRVSFSPDGSRIVFDAVDGAHGKLFVMKADGFALTEYPNGANSFLPSFAAHGGTVIYTGMDPDGRVSVFTVNDARRPGLEAHCLRCDRWSRQSRRRTRGVLRCFRTGRSRRRRRHGWARAKANPRRYRVPPPAVQSARLGEVLFTTLNPPAVHSVRTESGKQTVLVTGKELTWDADFGPDGKRVAYTDLLDPAAPNMRVSPSEIYEFSRTTKRSRRLTSSDVSLNSSSPRIAPTAAASSS